MFLEKYRWWHDSYARYWYWFDKADVAHQVSWKHWAVPPWVSQPSHQSRHRDYTGLGLSFHFHMRIMNIYRSALSFSMTLVAKTASPREGQQLDRGKFEKSSQKKQMMFGKLTEMLKTHETSNLVPSVAGVVVWPLTTKTRGYWNRLNLQNYTFYISLHLGRH